MYFYLFEFLTMYFYLARFLKTLPPNNTLPSGSLLFPAKNYVQSSQYTVKPLLSVRLIEGVRLIGHGVH